MTVFDHSAALFESFRVLGESIPGFRCEFGPDDVGTIDLTTPFALFNGVVTRTLRPSVKELEVWAERHRASARPWSIQLRGRPTDEILALTQAFGLREVHHEPLMVLPLDLLLPSAQDGSASVVGRVAGQMHHAYEQTLTQGSGAPPGSLSAISSAEVLDHPKVGAYLAFDSAEAVATGMTTMAGSTLGILNMSTLPDWRRRGRARQILLRMLADGRREGATHAILQSSPDGLSLYESVGFRTVETWTYLMTAD